MYRTGDGENPGFGHVAAELAGLAPDASALGHPHGQHNLLLALDGCLARPPQLHIVRARPRHASPSPRPLLLLAG